MRFFFMARMSLVPGTRSTYVRRRPPGRTNNLDDMSGYQKKEYHHKKLKGTHTHTLKKNKRTEQQVGENIKKNLSEKLATQMGLYICVARWLFPLDYLLLTIFSRRFRGMWGVTDMCICSMLTNKKQQVTSLLAKQHAQQINRLDNKKWSFTKGISAIKGPMLLFQEYIGSVATKQWFAV